MLFSRSASLVLRARAPVATARLTGSSGAPIAASQQWIVTRKFSADAKQEKSMSVDEAKLEKLTQEIMNLNLMEVVQFVNIMEKKLGLGDVRAMMQNASAAPSAGGAAASGGKDAKKDAAPAAPAKSVFELKLESFEAGDKIKVIKTVREITGLGLKEAKDIVEGAPKVLLKDVTKDQGTQLVEKLKASGAKASLV